MGKRRLVFALSLLVAAPIVFGGPYYDAPEALALAALERASGADSKGAGWSVSASADGATAVVAAPRGRGGPFGADETMGVAWLLEKGVDSHSTIFLSPESKSLLFGSSAAISPDGSVVVIGAPGSTP